MSITPSWDPTSEGPYNDFNPSITYNDDSAEHASMGMGFYRQLRTVGGGEPDPSRTVYMVHTVDGMGTVNQIQVSPDEFPTVAFFGVNGLGHFSDALKRGLPNNDLFFTYAHPVTSSGSGGACIMCGGVRKNLEVLGVRVTP
jgi:hypothetical protein